MQLAKVCALGLCGLALSVAPAAAAGPLLGMKIDAAKKTDFFTWFHLEQTASEAAQDGTLVTFKPESKKFHKLVTVKVTLDGTQTIRGMELVLARAFVDHPFDNVFARDIAKSLLRDAVPRSDAAAITDLMNEIQWGSPTQMIAGRKPPKLPDPPTAGYLAFLGKRESFAQGLGKTRLTIKNHTDEKNGDSVALEVSFKSEV